ncbi:MAG TPA: hypothetical protein PLA92_09730 [Fimbriimonadaceae bacterium]|nr:hypothetical protein [Fimbriimonadaceae bacterium]
MSFRVLRQWLLVGTGAVLAALMLAVCSGKDNIGRPLSTGSASASGPGFKLDTPEGWTAVDLTADDVNSYIDEAVKANPGLKASEPAIREMALSGSIKLVAFGETFEGFAENLNVVVLDQPKELAASELQQAYLQEMTALAQPGTSPQGELTDLPAGKAAKMFTQISVGQGKSIASLAYMLSNGNRSFTVTFSCPMSRLGAMERLADSVMQTFRFP